MFILFDNFVSQIRYICYETKDCDEIYENIMHVLKNYNPGLLNEIIENEIDMNYNNVEIQTLDENNNPYYMYQLYNSKLFDIIHIKWTKKSSTRIHDNPKLGCFIYTLNDGKLIQHIYQNSIIFNRLIRYNSDKLTYGKIGYINGNIELHKLCAEEYTETLHICIPGNYKTKYYN